MKNFLFIVLLASTLLGTTTSFGQTQKDLNTFNKERLSLQKKGMGVLGIWAIGNITTGIIGYNASEGSVAELYKMNAIWNGINLALAVPGYIGASRGKYDLSFRRTYKEQAGVEKTFLFNAALDGAYVLGGLYMTEKSKNEPSQSKQQMFLGYGNSIMLQGGFLLLFDATMFALHNRHGNKKLNLYLDKITLSSNGIGFRHQF